MATAAAIEEATSVGIGCATVVAPQEVEPSSPGCAVEPGEEGEGTAGVEGREEGEGTAGVEGREEGEGPVGAGGGGGGEGEPCGAAHDDGVAHGQLLEVAEVFGDVPGHVATEANLVAEAHGHDGADLAEAGRG